MANPPNNPGNPTGNPSFFDPSLNSYRPGLEPPGFDILRELLIRQIIGMKQNPYGMSPAGMNNIQGPLFSSGLRPQQSLSYFQQGGNGGPQTRTVGPRGPQGPQGPQYDAYPFDYGNTGQMAGLQKAGSAPVSISNPTFQSPWAVEAQMSAGQSPKAGFSGTAPWAQQQPTGVPPTLASLGNPMFNQFLAMNPGSHGAFGSTPQNYTPFDMEAFMSGNAGPPISGGGHHDGFDAPTPQARPQPRRGWFWDLLNQVGNRKPMPGPMPPQQGPMPPRPMSPPQFAGPMMPPRQAPPSQFAGPIQQFLPQLRPPSMMPFNQRPMAPPPGPTGMRLPGQGVM